MTWGKAEVGVDVLFDITKVTEGIQEGLDAYEEILKVSGTALKTIAQIKSFGNRSAGIIQTLIDGARDAIPQDWIEQRLDVGIYMLDMPLINPFEGGPRQPQIPGNSLDNIMLSSRARSPSSEVTGSGGNYGVYRKIVESIYDPGDRSKPTLSRSSQSGVLLLVYGAQSAGDAFNISLSLNDLFEGALSIPPVTGSVPVPQNVKTQFGGAFADNLAPEVATGRGTGIDVTVTWDQEPLFRKYLRENPIGIRLVSWHLYIKEGGQIEPGEDLKEYEEFVYEMPTGDIPESAAPIDATVPYEAVIQGLAEGQVYYVSVGYTVDIEDQLRDSRTILEPTVAMLSDQLRIRLIEQKAPTEHVRGTPPDWRSLKSPAAAVPGLEEAYEGVVKVANQVEKGFGKAENPFSRNVERAQKRVEALNESLNFVADVVERFQAQLQAINGATKSTEAGLWAKVLHVSGGRTAFMNEIGSALLDGQENAPPFTDGTGFVGALAFVVEGETLVEVDAVLSILKTLFEGGEDDTAVTSISEDPVQDITESDPVLQERRESVTASELGMTSEDASPQGDDSTSSTLGDTEVGDDPCEDN